MTTPKGKIAKNLSPEDRKAEDINRMKDYLDGYIPDADALPGLSRRAKPARKKDLFGLIPDVEDKKNIKEFIKTYNIAFPYPHPESLQAAFKEGIKGTIRDKTKIRKATKKGTPTLVMHLPMPFVIGLKKAYPVLFADKGQYAWFMKNFPEFSLKV